MALKDDFRPSKVESIFSFKYHYIIVNLLAWTILCTLISFSNGLLFPRESESREIKELNGIWNFRVDNSSTRTAGFDKEWYQKPLKQVFETLKLAHISGMEADINKRFQICFGFSSPTGHVIPMPVPSSYNDITQDRKIRDFVGWAWYDVETFVPKHWDDEDKIRVVLRFESCHYFCVVYVNGVRIMKHVGGHLPFEAEVTSTLNFGKRNRVTVAVNNTLTPTTLPPGTIEYMNNTARYPPGYFVQNLQMDFFNYAGLHRPVKLYTTPTVYLSDITVTTDFRDDEGLVTFDATVGAMDKVDEDGISTLYELFDANDNKVAEVGKSEAVFKGILNVSDVHLWWPIGMNSEVGYLYKLKVTVESNAETIDVYHLSVGIRTIDVDDGKFLINGQSFYFRGFGRHEDADIRGKGLDLPILIKDYNLMKWMSSNSFRTSHYPYSDEEMDMADQEGFVIIDESPGVGIEENNMEEVNLRHHLDVMKEMVQRDKNHPSVVMWSVANEPRTDLDQSVPYFKALIQYTRELDPTRPVTFVTNQRADSDLAVQFTDVICVNRYYAWYHDYGHTELIQRQLEYDLTSWYNKFEKPVLQTEYGADTIPGLHREPSVMFSEEYQVDSIRQYFPIFDKYRSKFFVGEMIWNFADFNTDQDIKRVAGNKKGIFTRQRQPKWAAHILRARYHELAKEDAERYESVLKALIEEN